MSEKRPAQLEEQDCYHSEQRFSLIKEPWIPIVFNPEVITRSSDESSEIVFSELGLKDTLLSAHEIKEVSDESPLVTASIHKLLIAIVHAVHSGPKDSEEWNSLWQEHRFDENKVSNYFEKWKSRFWLFHNERPFLQWPHDDLSKDPVPLTKLMFSAAAGENATLFDHTLDSVPTKLTPSEAIRVMLAYLSFAAGGGIPGVASKGSAAPWKSGYVFFLEGKNLFETLLLNTLNSEVMPEYLRSLGYPEWELDEPSKPTSTPQSKYASLPESYLHYLTAPSRRLRLCPPVDEDKISQVRTEAGVAFDASKLLDPFMLHRVDRSSKGESAWKSLKPDSDRALWRDSGALIAWKDTDSFRIPLPIMQATNRLERGAVSTVTRFGLKAFALRSGKNAQQYLLWRQERLPLSVERIADPAYHTLVQDCLEICEAVSISLGASVSAFCSALVSEGETNGNLRTHLGISRSFWTALETPFKRNVLQAKPTDDHEAIRLEWGRSCTKLAETVARNSINSLAPATRTIRASVVALQVLSSRLYKVKTDHNLF